MHAAQSSRHARASTGVTGAISQKRGRRACCGARAASDSNDGAGVIAPASNSCGTGITEHGKAKLASNGNNGSSGISVTAGLIRSAGVAAHHMALLHIGAHRSRSALVGAPFIQRYRRMASSGNMAAKDSGNVCGKNGISGQTGV